MIITQTTPDFPKATEEMIDNSKSIKEIFFNSEKKLNEILRKNAELEAESIASALQNDLSF